MKRLIAVSAVFLLCAGVFALEVDRAELELVRPGSVEFFNMWASCKN